MRVAVIGCGRMGSRRIASLLELGERDIHVWDSAVERQVRIAADYDVEVCASLGQLLGVKPDAALICTPPESHLDLLRQTYGAGVRAIFLEKPLALEMPDDDLLRLLAEDRVITMVGCNLRFLDRFAALKRLVRESNARHGVSVDLQASYHLPTVRPDYLESYVTHTGALFDVGWHMVDLAVDWLGPARLIDSFINSAEAIGLPAIDGRARLVLAHDAGVSTVWVDFTSQWYYLAGCVTLPNDASAATTYSQPPDSSMFTAETRHFIDCAREGKPTINPVGEATRVLRILLEAKGR